MKEEKWHNSNTLNLVSNSRSLRQDALKRSREEDIENDVSEHFVTPYKKVKVLETVVTSASSSKDLNPTNIEFSLQIVTS